MCVGGVQSFIYLYIYCCLFSLFVVNFSVNDVIEKKQSKHINYYIKKINKLKKYVKLHKKHVAKTW